ncbi:heparinase II/III family protein [Duganella sp. HH105]|uniref:heparinase II/III domain-containing protein n=1 Tax=Duganella sp. HH105 TaxID=1781067 RepID=UPI000877D91D|nr:heparinase II/III family protein [Duganella sp. HH105]OEZ61618.1 heparinase II/III-like protein [Duganella sp. HH105]
MKLSKYTAMCALLLGCAAIIPASMAATPADWITGVTDPLIVKPAPMDLAVQAQNPPAFAWPRYPLRTAVPITGYTLELSTVPSDGSAPKVTTFSPGIRNFYLPSKALDVGTYSWRVAPIGPTPVAWSSPRTFVIGAASAKFEVPDSAQLKANVVAKGRSRLLPADFKPFSAWTMPMMVERGAAAAALKKEVDAGIATMTPTTDSLFGSHAGLTPAELTALSRTIATKTNATLRQFVASAFAYRLFGETKYLTEAIKRGDEIAALDPNGPTAFAVQDQVHRGIEIALLEGSDVLWNSLDATRRGRWMSVAGVRIATIYNDMLDDPKAAVPTGRMDNYPFDSHGADAYGYLALSAALAIGDLPDADKWFNFAVRPYMNSIFFWSGPEGGHFSGSAYSLYMATYCVNLWGPLKLITGVDLYTKPWSIGFSRMLMEFIPPKSPGLVFGDEHEFAFDFSTLKSFASRFSNAENAWYARALSATGTTEDPLNLLKAEFPLPVSKVVTAVPPPNAVLFPSIGWTAMHSDINDLKRTSLYFKSSPFGSYNHAHGDQNAIVLDSGGVRLLSEAGYEDYYYSPLVINWYRTSRAHNTITFDSALDPDALNVTQTGQQLTKGNAAANLGSTGSVTGFKAGTATDPIDFVEGDATKAYNGALTKASRKIWYLRKQNTYVVLDTLASPTARQFEWNMHAVVPIVDVGGGKAKIVNGTSSVCLSSLSGDGTALAKVQPVKVPAPYTLIASKKGVTETHSAFVKPFSATSAEFLVVLDVGCKLPVVTVVPSAGGRTMTVNGTSITLPK